MCLAHFVAPRAESMIRLTNSGTEMPSRLASASNHAICGSVKEIRRLIMYLSLLL